MASPSPPGEEDAVCCMCGDHGLPHELFRCRSCRVRLQHSYCSDLYPRATSYRRCNWCLREPSPPSAQVGARAAGHAAAIAANGSNKPAAETKRKMAAATDEDRRQRRQHEGCSSRRAPAELGYPVKKKKRKADERAPPPEDAGVKKAGSCSNNAAGKSKEVMRAGKARVKVRRYKLLAEVISC